MTALLLNESQQGAPVPLDFLLPCQGRAEQAQRFATAGGSFQQGILLCSQCLEQFGHEAQLHPVGLMGKADCMVCDCVLHLALPTYQPQYGALSEQSARDSRKHDWRSRKDVKKNLNCPRRVA